MNKKFKQLILGIMSFKKAYQVISKFVLILFSLVLISCGSNEIKCGSSINIIESCNSSFIIRFELSNSNEYYYFQLKETSEKRTILELDNFMDNFKIIHSYPEKRMFNWMPSESYKFYNRTNRDATSIPVSIETDESGDIKCVGKYSCI